MITSRFVAALLAVGVSVVTGSQAALAQAAPYEINVILALTGAAGFIGRSEQQSLQVVESLTNRAGGINGRPIKFVIVDDQSSPQVSLQLANQLAAKGVPVILGPTFTATCLAVGPLVAKSGPVEYCFSPSVTPPAGGYSYSASVATHDDAIAIIRYYRERGWTRLGLMTSTDASGQQFEQYFDEALKLSENASVRAVAREHFNPTDLSITAQAARLKAANPQAMIGWSAGTPTGTLLRGLHDAGVDIPTAAGNGNMIYEQLAQYESFLPKELYFAGRRSLVFDPAAPPMIRRAEQTYFDAFKAIGVRPNIADTLAWDPAMIVIDALRHLGTGANAAQINGYIQHLDRWAGINGMYDFRNGNQRGLGIDSVVIDRWNEVRKEFVVVSRPGGSVAR